jgi:hypothetical protein
MIPSKITDESEFLVVLPDGSRCTVFAGQGHTLYEMLSPLADKLQQSLNFFDVVLPGSEEVIWLNLW